MITKYGLLSYVYCPIDAEINYSENNGSFLEYLNSGIIDERKIVVNFARLFQYFAPIVFGIISEKSKIIIVIIVETNPTKTSSEMPPINKLFSRFSSEYATFACTPTNIAPTV